MAPFYLCMEGISTTQERIDFLTTEYGFNTNTAKALILAELGYSHSGIASKLDVTSGTAKKYLRRLEEQIGEGVTESLPKSHRFKTFPDDTVYKEEPRYSGDYITQTLNRGAPLAECLNNLPEAEQA